MDVTKCIVGEMRENCYLVSDEITSQTAIIDPGEEADFISSILLEKKLIPQVILLTHGHYDHCLAALELKLVFNIPIYLHHKDLFLYEKAHQSARHFSGINIPKLPKIDHFISDGEQISIGSAYLHITHTPGHTPGSVCISTDSKLFSGDTWFLHDKSGTDHSYSSVTDLKKSLHKLHQFPRGTEILPGHGESFIY